MIFFWLLGLAFLKNLFIITEIDYSLCVLGCIFFCEKQIPVALEQIQTHSHYLQEPSHSVQ